MALNKKITQKIWDAAVIAASASDTTQAYGPGVWLERGYFSLQLTVAGTGTAKIEYECSNDGETFVTPTGAVDIVTAATAGTDLYSFSPKFAAFYRFKATETGGANSVTLTATLAVQ